MDTIRPVPIKLICVVHHNALAMGVKPKSLHMRRAKLAAINAYSMHGASAEAAVEAAHAVLGGIPMPIPPSGDAA